MLKPYLGVTWEKLAVYSSGQIHSLTLTLPGNSFVTPVFPRIIPQNQSVSLEAFESLSLKEKKSIFDFQWLYYLYLYLLDHLPLGLAAYHAWKPTHTTERAISYHFFSPPTQYNRNVLVNSTQCSALNRILVRTPCKISQVTREAK